MPTDYADGSMRKSTRTSENIAADFTDSAEAQLKDLTIVTHDQVFAAYKVDILWT